MRPSFVGSYTCWLDEGSSQYCAERLPPARQGAATIDPKYAAHARSGNGGTTAEHPNGSIVRRFFAAHVTSDLATLIEILAEDVIWHLPRGRTRLSADPTVVGLGALAEMSGRNVEASEGTFRFDVEHVFAGDTYAAVVTHNTAEAAGQSLDLRMVIQFKILDEKIVEAWESPDDIDEFLNFWSAIEA